MSSGSATPSCTRKIASFRAGTSILFTMNPGESFLQSTVSLPSFVDTSLTLRTVSSEVLFPRIISTRGMSWGGLKKCMPQTFCGFLVTDARRVMLMDDVLDARIVSFGISSAVLR